MNTTPQKPKARLSQEAKRQLLENLDFEVNHRTRQLESWLSHALQNFLVQQENQVTHISKQVRNLSMREFLSKYEGNVHVALKGIQREKINAEMKAAGIEDGMQSPKKRKWLATREDGDGASGSGDAEPLKAAKSARMMPATPKRQPAASGSGTGHRPRFNASTSKPGPSRIPQSPSPNKSRNPVGTTTTRPGSPSKPAIPPKSSRRPPSTTTFNPSIPKTRKLSEVRLPKRDEGLFSTNGSPIANPHSVGFSWFKMGDTEESGESDPKESTKAARKVKRTKSTISIRRDPSFAHGSSTSGLHSRNTSQASSLFGSTSTSDSSIPSTMYTAHSRSNSQAPESTANLTPDVLCTPKPLSRHGSAYVAIPTQDGHVLEFDALLTSPGAIDALEGITESAKKQARQEIGRLVQAAVDKWKIA